MTKPQQRSEWTRYARRIAPLLDQVCWICGGPIDATITRGRWRRTVDHVVPVHAGGPLLPPPEGLRLAHAGCNTGRGNKTRGRPRSYRPPAREGAGGYAREGVRMGQVGQAGADVDAAAAGSSVLDVEQRAEARSSSRVRRVGRVERSEVVAAPRVEHHRTKVTRPTRRDQLALLSEFEVDSLSVATTHVAPISPRKHPA